MSDFLVELQAILDQEKSKGNINRSINKMQKELDKLKLRTELDQKTVYKFVEQLETVLNQKITISNISIDSETGQQLGKTIAQNVADGIENAIGKIDTEVQKLTNQANDEAKELLPRQDDTKSAVYILNSFMGVLDNVKDKINSFQGSGLGTGITAFVKNFA